MGGLGRVWQVWKFMTQIQPDPLSKKIFVTQPNSPNPKNRPNPTSLIGFDGSVGWLHSPNHKWTNCWEEEYEWVRSGSAGLEFMTQT